MWSPALGEVSCAIDNESSPPRMFHSIGFSFSIETRTICTHDELENLWLLTLRNPSGVAARRRSRLDWHRFHAHGWLACAFRETQIPEAFFRDDAARVNRTILNTKGDFGPSSFRAMILHTPAWRGTKYENYIPTW